MICKNEIKVAWLRKKLWNCVKRGCVIVRIWIVWLPEWTRMCMIAWKWIKRWFREWTLPLRVPLKRTTGKNGDLRSLPLAGGEGLPVNWSSIFWFTAGRKTITKNAHTPLELQMVPNTKGTKDVKTFFQFPTFGLLNPSPMPWSFQIYCISTGAF